jgi:hypothetical protein
VGKRPYALFRKRRCLKGWERKEISCCIKAYQFSKEGLFEKRGMFGQYFDRSVSVQRVFENKISA